jgi:hypothetical protein
MSVYYHVMITGKSTGMVYQLNLSKATWIDVLFNQIT